MEATKGTKGHEKEEKVDGMKRNAEFAKGAEEDRGENKEEKTADGQDERVQKGAVTRRTKGRNEFRAPVEERG